MSATIKQVLRPSQRTIITVVQTSQSPLQMDLFGGDYKAEWTLGFIDAAKQFKDAFWPSQVRAIYPHPPASSKWYGAAYHKLLKLGARKTGEYRNSIFESRNGSIEWQWRWPT